MKQISNLSLAISLFFLLLTATSLVRSTPAMAQQPAERATYHLPSELSEMDQVDLFLITGGVGEEVNDRFGHIGLRVVNHADDSDVVFNWGELSFDETGFLWKFFRGQLNYRMGLSYYRSDVASYALLGRRLEMNHLNLTSAQKRRVMLKILWNVDPENRNFSYQYWTKNCATIPRDYLDDALSGAIRKKFASEPAGRVYRDYVLSNLSFIPFVAPLLDVMMNSNIDRPITIWEDMFLPKNLQKWLLELPAIDDRGLASEREKLLGPTTILLDNNERYDPFLFKGGDYLLLILPLLLSLLALLSQLIPLRLGTGGRQEKISSRSLLTTTLGAATSYFGIYSGLFGVTLALNWAFSGHPDGWHNLNLLQFWPSDLLFIWLGVAMIKKESLTPINNSFLRLLRALSLGHLATSLLLLMASCLGFFQQDISRAVLWFGLPNSLLMALLAFKVHPLAAIVTNEATKSRKNTSKKRRS